MNSRSPAQQQKLDNQLLKHAKKGNYKKVRADLNEGADIHAKNEMGLGVLQLAEQGKKACEAAWHQSDKATERFDKEAYLVDMSGYELTIKILTHHLASKIFTPLHQAAQDGDLSQAQLLLRNGADPDISFVETGETPLLVAAKFGYANIVQLLLARGASDQMADHQGRTPLDIATLRKHVDVVRVLTAGKTPPCAGPVPVEEMQLLFNENKYHELEELLVEHKCAPVLNDLVRAINAGRVEMVSVLLRQGVNPNKHIKVDAGQITTPLHIACAKGFFDIADILIAFGARTDAKNAAGRTPFDLAAMNSKMEALRIFDHDQWLKETRESDLINAVKCESFESIKRQLTRRPDFISLRENGQSLLHLAAARGIVSICELLIDHGAPIDIDVDREVKNKPNLDHNVDRLTPMAVAFRAGRDDVFMLFHEKGVRLNYLNTYITDYAQRKDLLKYRALDLVIADWFSSPRTLADIKAFTERFFLIIQPEVFAKILLSLQKIKLDLNNDALKCLQLWVKDKIKGEGGYLIKGCLVDLMGEILPIADRLAMYELALKNAQDNWISFALNVKQNILDPRTCDSVKKVKQLASVAREQVLQSVAVVEPVSVSVPVPLLDVDGFELIQSEVVSPPASPLLRHSHFAVQGYQDIELQEVGLGEDGGRRFVERKI